jgi:ABC-type thiamin/hydroxymethylpyrimidine transport system permease subunit
MGQDFVFLVLELCSFATAFYFTFIGFVLAWDWHFSIPFQFGQIFADGAFCLDTKFGLSSILGTLLGGLIVATLFLIFANREQDHVRVIGAVFSFHLAATSYFGFPVNSVWWFANVLSWLLACLVAGFVTIYVVTAPAELALSKW